MMESQARKIINELIKNNYEGYFIGGYSRNTLHNLYHNDNLHIKDYDIVTNARYEEVLKIFKDVEERGAMFKIAVVCLDGYEFEVAQYRKESYPVGGSLRPNAVYNANNLSEDVMRRDFTMNGIAMTYDGEIIDHCNGVADIKNKIIRTIGNPNERFAEDPLRMIRAFRFVSQLDYRIDPETKQGIKKNLHLLDKIPHERIKNEVHKIFKGKAIRRALDEMKSAGVHKYYFMNSITGKPVHLFESFFKLKEDLYDSTICSLEYYRKIGMDIAETYYLLYRNVNYEVACKEMKNSMFLNEKDLERAMLMLKHKYIVINQDINNICSLIKDVGEQRGEPYLRNLINSYAKFSNANLKTLLDILEKRKLFKYQLNINGNDILEYGKSLGLKPGKWVGEVLDRVQILSIHGEEYDIEDIMRRLMRNEIN